MRDRVIIDRAGIRWTVSETAAPLLADEIRERRAEPRSQSRVVRKRERFATRPLAMSALLFDSANERRRLTPAPADWESLPDDELEDLLNRTTVDSPPTRAD